MFIEKCVCVSYTKLGYWRNILVDKDSIGERFYWRKILLERKSIGEGSIGEIFHLNQDLLLGRYFHAWVMF